jgi:hypothetical protein
MFSAPARACHATARLGLVMAATIAIASCTSGGGGGGGSVAGASGSGSGGGSPTGAPANFQNPAWYQNVPSPSVYWPKNPGPDPVLAAWFGQHAWLSDISSWVSHMENGRQPGRDLLGAYGVGNGRVFGMAGLSYPLNTLHGMIGPTYQVNANYFGDMSVGLDIGRPIAFQHEWAMMPRRAGVVITRALANEAEMFTVDFAPPDLDAILRIIVVRNPSATQASSDIRVTARLAGGTFTEGARLVQDRGDRRITVGAAFGQGSPTVLGETVRLPIGVLQPGEERTALVYCAITRSSDAAGRQALLQRIESTQPQVFLEQTRDHWQQFFAAGAQFAFPDAKVQDFIEGMIVCCKVQTGENGCTSPMSRYTKTWMRDQEGPLRLYMRTGRPEPMRRMLESYYKTSIMTGGIQNSMPVDMDVRQAGTAPDWMAASFMPGREPTEAPSYIPIEYYDFYMASGDQALLVETYDYMKAAVLRQGRTPENLMKFNGDEPFRWVLMVATGLYEPENRGWSSNSAFLFVAAADRMAKIATLLGKHADAALFQQEADAVRAATEQKFWLAAQGYYDVARLFYGDIPVGKPFEDISLVPLRIGYGDKRHPNVRQNLLSVKALLETTDGLPQSPALINGIYAFDGMVPGYYLENLAIIDHPDAERTFNALAKVASVSGEIAEGHFATGSYPAVLIGYDPAGGADVVARYRPWEGGICADGALRYLFGEEWNAPAGRVALTPHLPNGWGEMTARGLKVGGQVYDVEVRDFGLRRLERVTNRSSAPLTVDLGASVKASSIGQVRQDGIAIALPPIDAEFGRISFRVERTLQAGEWIDLDFDYAP